MKMSLIKQEMSPMETKMSLINRKCPQWRSQYSQCEILDALGSAREKETVTRIWKAILSCMKQDNTVSTMDIDARLNVSDKTVKRDIQSMNSFIRVQWTGSRRYGHWEIAAV